MQIVTGEAQSPAGRSSQKSPQFKSISPSQYLIEGPNLPIHQRYAFILTPRVPLSRLFVVVVVVVLFVLVLLLVLLLLVVVVVVRTSYKAVRGEEGGSGW